MRHGLRPTLGPALLPTGLQSLARTLHAPDIQDRRFTQTFAAVGQFWSDFQRNRPPGSVDHAQAAIKFIV